MVVGDDGGELVVGDDAVVSVIVMGIQCVRATFTLAVVVTVVNQKSPKSPVGGISPNL